MENRNVESLRKILSFNLDFVRYYGVFNDHDTPFELAILVGLDDVIDVFIERYGLKYLVTHFLEGFQLLVAAASKNRVDLIRRMLKLRDAPLEITDFDEDYIEYVEIFPHENLTS